MSVIAERLLAWPEETPVILLSPIPAARRANPKQLLADLARQGFLRVRIGGDIVETEEASPDALADLSLRADIVVDRLKLRKSSRGRLTESLDLASRLSGGRVSAMNHRTREETAFSTNFSCPLCDFSLKKLEPGLFSPQTARGRCPTCGGTGTVPSVSIESIIHPELSLRAGAIPNWGDHSPKHFALLAAAADQASVSVDTPWKELTEDARGFILHGSSDQPEFPGIESLITKEAEALPKADREKLLGPLLKEKTCPDCEGEKLSREARNVFLSSGGKLYSYPSLLRTPISELEPLLGSLELGETARAVADRILPPILDRLRYLNSVGPTYLTLDRPVTTLSGGESQRIRLACELSSGLSGVMYVLDEPSTGLHPADNEKLLDSLKKLRDAGNSVIVVEHDEDTIRSADYLIDMGPGSGESGGEVIASGTLKEILKDPKSVTGTYLSHPETTVQRNRSRRIGKKLLIKGDNLFDQLFANNNKLLTVNGSEFAISNETRRLLALFSDGTYLVSKDNRFDGAVYNFEANVKRRKIPIKAPRYVTLNEIAAIYAYAERGAGTVDVSAEEAEDMQMQIDFINIIQRASQKKVSDVHVVVGSSSTVLFRENGIMVKQNEYGGEWGEAFVRSVFASADISDSNYSQNEFQGAQKLGSTPLRGSKGKLMLPHNVLAIRLQFNPIAFGSQY
ncbi:MAG: hypothetical protein V8S69_05435, partial [Dakarella massiliensis]